jgi:hypothetical protein
VTRYSAAYWSNQGLKDAAHRRAALGGPTGFYWEQAIMLELRKLPSAFAPELSSQKLATAYAYVYDAYSGAGHRVYQPSAASQ